MEIIKWDKVTRDSEMSEGYELYSGIPMGSNILGAQPHLRLFKQPGFNQANAASACTSSDFVWSAGRKDHATRRKTHFCIIAQVKSALLTLPDKSFPAYYFL